MLKSHGIHWKIRFDGKWTGADVVGEENQKRPQKLVDVKFKGN